MGNLHEQAVLGNMKLFQEQQMLVRILDYVRLEIEAGIITQDTPLFIAYRDYIAVQPTLLKDRPCPICYQYVGHKDSCPMSF
jgi:hypothetical protein